jgi:hypothetical protein
MKALHIISALLFIYLFFVSITILPDENKTGLRRRMMGVWTK